MNTDFIYGRQPVLEALKSEKKIEKIFFLKGVHGENIGEIMKLAKVNNIPTSYVPQHKIQKFTKANHQGVVAMSAIVDYVDLQQVIDFIFQNGEDPFLVVVEGITDTRNLGAVARSAYCMGAHAIILNQKNTAPVNADVIKTSAGSANKITWCKEKNIQSIMETLANNGIVTYASDLKANQTLDRLQLDQPLAIILGSEDEGISSYVQKNCTQSFIIPMAKEFDSLNVSVAAGICFYQIHLNRTLST